MARALITILFVLPFLFTSSCRCGNSQSNQEGYISVEISNKGLAFVKDLLINKAVSSLVPFKLPQIEKSVKIPLIGKVHIVLSNITLCQFDASSSTIHSGDTGITIVASGATANLSMHWNYSYSSWLLPTISDKGSASVDVEGVEVGFTLGLKNQHGALNLSILECGCYVEEISMKLDGGASWLYQGVVDAFEGKIISAVEDAISQKIRDGVIKLGYLLQSLPKEVSIDSVSALNVTLMNDPVLSNSSIKLEIDGLFTAKGETGVSNHYNKYLQASVSCINHDEMVRISILEIDGLFTAEDETGASNHYNKYLQASVSCINLDEMVRISVHENVLNSASLVYFNADVMHWIVDKIPDQALLNTAGWKYIVPQLYKQYPNDDMSLNISLSSPPILNVGMGKIDATFHSDVTIHVLNFVEVIPVACISVVIRASGYAEISRNTLAASVRLNEFAMSLKWSTIGHLRIHLVQDLISVALQTVVLPLLNLQLHRGLPLPRFHGYTLQNVQVLCFDSKIIICSDVASFKQEGLNLL